MARHSVLQLSIHFVGFFVFLMGNKVARCRGNEPSYFFILSSQTTTRNYEIYLTPLAEQNDRWQHVVIDFNPLSYDHPRDLEKARGVYRALSAVSPGGVVIFGYSITGKFAAKLAQTESNVRGLALIDPTDGGIPFRPQDRRAPVFLASRNERIAVPTLLLEAEFGASRGYFRMPCVLPGLGAAHFAAHIEAHLLTWLKVEGAGHLDVIGPPLHPLAPVFCARGKRPAREIAATVSTHWRQFIRRFD